MFVDTSQHNKDSDGNIVLTAFRNLIFLNINTDIKILLQTL